MCKGYKNQTGYGNPTGVCTGEHGAVPARWTASLGVAPSRRLAQGLKAVPCGSLMLPSERPGQKRVDVAGARAPIASHYDMYTPSPPEHDRPYAYAGNAHRSSSFLKHTSLAQMLQRT